MNPQKEITIGNVRVGNERPFTLIGGPDSLESEEHALFLAGEIKKICAQWNTPFIFKASFDKANRTAWGTFRGVGLAKGLEILARIKEAHGIPVTTDIHLSEQASLVANVVDLIQIPALLSRQTDLLYAAGKTGKAVNIKKGQFMSLPMMSGAIGKVEASGNTNILITERGTTFGYGDLVADMRNLALMQQHGYPVIFDASHTVQLPSSHGTSSGGMRELIPVLARAAIASGIAGIFLEIHDQPDRAPVDGENSLALSDLPHLLEQLTIIDRPLKKYIPGTFKKERAHTYELWFRAPYKQLIQEKKITTALRPGDRRSGMSKGVAQGEHALIRIIKTMRGEQLHLPPEFDEFETRVMVSSVTVKQLADLTPDDLNHTSPDCRTPELAAYHLGLTYNRVFDPSELVSLVNFAYLE